MNQLLSPSDIAVMLNLPKRATLKLVSQPYFPAPAINLSERLRRWKRDKIELWLDDQEKQNSR